MYEILLFITLLVACGLVIITIPPAMYVSLAKNLFDLPNERKVHLTAIPNIGGVAIFIGIVLTTLLVPEIVSFDKLKYVIAAMIILFFIGLKDDLVILAPKTKLIAQIIAASILIFLGDFRITNMYGIFGIYELNYITSYILTFVTIVGVVNSYNLIDGIDGLASGLGILGSLLLGTWFFATGNYSYATLSFALAGSLIGFIRFNLFSKKNKVFMGDSGSLIVGLIMAVLLIGFLNLNLNSNFPFTFENAPAIAYAVLFIPITDTLRVIFIRLFHKRSPFSPDKNHLHHSLLFFFPKHIEVTSIILLMNVGMIVFAYSISFLNFSVNLQFWLLLVIGFIFCFTPGLIANFVYNRKQIVSRPKEIVRHTIVSLFFTQIRVADKESVENIDIKEIN